MTMKLAFLACIGCHGVSYLQLLCLVPMVVEAHLVSSASCCVLMRKGSTCMVCIPYLAPGAGCRWLQRDAKRKPLAWPDCWRTCGACASRHIIRRTKAQCCPVHLASP